MRVQRLRVTFGRGERLKYITHLDLMRFWERALRRAEIPLAYSEGFSPHAQISLAAPLPLGVTSRAELMDVFLSEPMPADPFERALSAQIPSDLNIIGVEEIPVAEPSAQSLLRAAEYLVRLSARVPPDSLRNRIEAMMARTSMPWHQQREHDVRSYDLRPLIQQLRVDTEQSGCGLVMRLQADNTATGRPDQVVAALGLPPAISIERTRLVLAPFPHQIPDQAAANERERACD